MIADIRDDTRISDGFRDYLTQSRWRALAMIPLIVHNQRFGLVWLGYPSIRTWSEADLYPYQVTAALLAAAIDNRRQYLLLSERGQQLAVLEERRRLARELHNSVTQSLFSMSLLAQALPDLWDIDREEARAGLAQIRDLTRSALAEMRALLFELRPAALGEQGLAHALREHVGAFERSRRHRGRARYRPRPGAARSRSSRRSSGSHRRRWRTSPATPARGECSVTLRGRRARAHADRRRRSGLSDSSESAMAALA